MPLTITYSPISVGKLRMWVNMQESMKMLHQLGEIHIIALARRASGCHLDTQTPKNHLSGQSKYFVGNFVRCKFQAYN